MFKKSFFVTLAPNVSIRSLITIARIFSKTTAQFANDQPYHVKFEDAISTTGLAIFVRLGPIPKLKLEGKRFGPKQNTKFPYYHHPPNHCII